MLKKSIDYGAGLVTLFRVGLFYLQLTLRQLIQRDVESRFIVRSQLGPCIQSGSSPSAVLQVVKKSTHLSKDCYPQLIWNPLCSEIQPPKQLDYRCMPLHPAMMFDVTTNKDNHAALCINASLNNLNLKKNEILKVQHSKCLSFCDYQFQDLLILI